MKIDQTFIDLIGKDIAAERLVRATTVLDNEVIAEGVETSAQAALLRETGVNRDQDWLWPKAVGPLELETWLEASSV